MGQAFNLRRYMGGKPLPYDAEIDYLESTGTQYINTGYIPKSDEFRVVYAAYCNPSGNNIFVSVYNQSIGNYFHINWYGNSAYFRYLGQDNSYSVPNGYHVFEIGHQIKIDGELKKEFEPSPYYYENNENPLLLMAYNTSVQLPFRGRTYYVKAYLGDELKLDLIPVRVGQIGYLYDKISHQLFGNAGTGNFVLGKDKGVKQIEFLQGVQGAFVNTGVLINSNNWRKIRIEFDGSFVSETNNAWRCIGIGYKNPTFYIAISNSNKLAYGKGNGNDGQTSRTLTQAEYTSRHLYIADYVNGKVYFDNEEYEMSLAQTTQLNNEFYIFTWNSNNYSGQNYTVGGKIYSFRIFEDGVKIRDFIPFRIDSIGYLYDNVSGQFFGNAGTGDFILGSDV